MHISLNKLYMFTSSYIWISAIKFHQINSFQFLNQIPHLIVYYQLFYVIFIIISLIHKISLLLITHHNFLDLCNYSIHNPCKFSFSMTVNCLCIPIPSQFPWSYVPPVTILSFFATFIYLVNKPFMHFSVKQLYMFVSSYTRISFSSQLATYIFQYPIDFLDHQFPYNYSILLCYHHFFNAQILYPYFT
jgi:hypothetical protein